MIAPSTPWGTSSANARMSASEEIPPLATTRASVRSQTRSQQVKVRAGQHAIGGHVGDHVSATAGSVQPLQRGVQLAAVAGPAPGSQGAPPDVQPDRDPVTEGADDLRTPFGTLQGCGTDVDPSAAGRQRTLEAGVVSDPAREFDVETCMSRELRDELGVVPAAEGRIEIDQMQPFSTGALPALDGAPGDRRTASRCPPRPGPVARPGPRRYPRPAAAPAVRRYPGNPPDDPTRVDPSQRPGRFALGSLATISS